MSVLLMILDGWGLNPKKRGNAILTARTPNFGRLWKSNPHTKLNASGKSVGLPAGFMGNSEVGHLHIGAGRLIQQDLTRINKAIKDGSFFKNKVLVETMKMTRKSGALHLMGLLSDSGVHSHINHLFALLEAAKKYRIKEVYVHCFLDGRDTSPKSASKYLKKLKNYIQDHPNVKIASIMGRFYAMDRDTRWDRERLAYEVLVEGKGEVFDNPLEALEDAYKKGETDEFVKPRIIKEDFKKITAKDTVIFFNFRTDRAREITRVFTDKKFTTFKRKYLRGLRFVCLTQYDETINAPVIMSPLEVENSLGEILSYENKKQLRIAETEKYAHVTYFFNGLSGRIFKNEDRILIPSPKVRTYDLKPEMSALKVTEKLIKKIESNVYDFILVNFANPDMVGHTGDFKAAIKAVETVDKCLGKVVKAAKDYDILIIADHGTAEVMLNPDGTPNTAHTTNPVPFIAITKNKVKLKPGNLYNIAPTVLELLKLRKPSYFSDSLLKK